MLTIEKWVGMSPEQYEIVIEGMRNPMNSWDKSDSCIEHIEDPETLNIADFQFHLGEADEALMMSLGKGGPVNAKYRRMMPVWVTINAPLYWWKEFDTYKVGTVSNSCSTMHKIHAKEFTLDDFSCEHLLGNEGYDFADMHDFMDFEETDGNIVKLDPLSHLEDTIRLLNFYRNRYLAMNSVINSCARNAEELKGLEKKRKRYWWQMIQLLPSSYNQKRTVMLSYEVGHNIDMWRKNHKLDEWHTFCDWLESLPNSKVITVKGKE